MVSLLSWYQKKCASKEIDQDDAQLNLIYILDEFLQNFVKSSKKNFFGKVKSKVTINRNFITSDKTNVGKLGYYIYGGVGRGKTMIMNAAFNCTQTSRKSRQHFHEFMHQIHQKLSSLTHIDNPLQSIAKELKKSVDIIYLDEMHISDIAAAMIIGRLLESLFAEGIYIITSSNFQPNGLYPDGLMRERFLPAIGLMEQKLIIYGLDSKQDYRLFNDSDNLLYFINDKQAHAKLDKEFNKIADNAISSQQNILIQSREIKVIRYADNVIWFDFAHICGDMRSQLDYLEIAQKFKTVIIENITPLNESKKDLARRFTWLIDILYDNHNYLLLSSSCPIVDIYPTGDFANEFTRTVSRLEEMNTIEYNQK